MDGVPSAVLTGVFGLFVVVLCFYWCCCRREDEDAWKEKCSPETVEKILSGAKVPPADERDSVLSPKYDESVAVARKCLPGVHTARLKESPHEALSWAQRGKDHVRLGSYKLALVDFSEALRLEPGKMDMLVARGNVHRMIGSNEAAFEDFMRALTSMDDKVRSLEQEKQSSSHTEDLVLHLHGRAYFHWTTMYDPYSAIADFTEAIRHDPPYSESWVMRALLWMELGHFKRAEEDLCVVRKEHRDDDAMRILFTRAVVRQILGKSEEALSDLVEGEKLSNPRFDKKYVLKMRAVVKLLKGDYVEAEKVLVEAFAATTHGGIHGKDKLSFPVLMYKLEEPLRVMSERLGSSKLSLALKENVTKAVEAREKKAKWRATVAALT